MTAGQHPTNTENSSIVKSYPTGFKDEFWIQCLNGSVIGIIIIEKEDQRFAFIKNCLGTDRMMDIDFIVKTGRKYPASTFAKFFSEHAATYGDKNGA